MSRYRAKRQSERIENLNKLFKLLRHYKALNKLTDKVYLSYKQELINIQKNYIKIRKILS